MGGVLIGPAICGTVVLAQTAFEIPPKLKVSECVPEPLRKGKNFTVDDPVSNDGFWNIYSLRTEVGNLTVHGSFLLTERIQESHALAELKKTDEIVLLGQGAVHSITHIGKSLYTAASKPTETAEGLWPGLKRLADRVRTSTQKMSEGLKPPQDNQAQGDQKPGGQKLAANSLAVAESFLGMHAIERRWARKLGIDPYTTNADLRRELQRVAAFEAAGGTVAKTFAHIPLAVSIAVTVSDMVWEKGPDELAKINEQRLAEMGVGSEASRGFLGNGYFSLTRQTAVVSALSGLGDAGGRDAWIRQAAQADTEELAVFYTEGAGMLLRFNKEQARVRTLLPDSVLPAAFVEGNRVVYLVPADYVVWTEELHGRVTDATERVRGQFPGASLEVWMTGIASERARQGLESLGWQVHERVLNRLPVSM